MINVLNMNIVGNVNSKSKMFFEFTIDNSTELPKSGLYQLGDKIYVIAEGSKAVDIADKVVYKFINNKWVRTKDTYNPSTTSVNTITTNGNYTIASNMLTGITDVNANVEPTGLIEKDITENGEYIASDDNATGYSKVVVDVAMDFNYIAFANPDDWFGNGLICKEDSGNYLLSNGQYIFSAHGTHYAAYLLTPVNTLKPMEIETGRVGFTPTESFELLHRDGTPIETTGDTVTPGDGKLYYLDINYNQSFQRVVTITKTDKNFQSFIIG